MPIPTLLLARMCAFSSRIPLHRLCSTLTGLLLILAPAGAVIRVLRAPAF